MKQIPLTQGKFAIVDDEDFDFLNQWKWCCRSDGYAVRGRMKSEYPGTICIRMHRFILNVDNDKMVDHINGNRLDNRKSNLRACNQSENMNNGSMHKDSIVPFKGVSKKRNKFRARIFVRGVEYSLGSFDTPEEAHEAYCKKAKELCGEFARG